MSSSNPFAEYYKTITDSALLAILDNPQDYQASAIEAAKAELESRQLSESAILEARQPLLEKEQAQAAEREKRKMKEEKLKAAGTIYILTKKEMRESFLISTDKAAAVIIIAGLVSFLIVYGMS